MVEPQAGKYASHRHTQMVIASNQTCFVQTGFGITTHIPEWNTRPVWLVHNTMSWVPLPCGKQVSVPLPVSFPFPSFLLHGCGLYCINYLVFPSQNEFSRKQYYIVTIEVNALATLGWSEWESVTQLPPARGIQCEFHLKVRTGTTQAQFHSSYHHYLPNYCVSCSHLLKGQLSRLKLQEIWNISGLNFFCQRRWLTFLKM